MIRILAPACLAVGILVARHAVDIAVLEGPISALLPLGLLALLALPAAIRWAR